VIRNSSRSCSVRSRRAFSRRRWKTSCVFFRPSSPRLVLTRSRCDRVSSEHTALCAAPDLDAFSPSMSVPHIYPFLRFPRHSFMHLVVLFLIAPSQPLSYPLFLPHPFHPLAYNLFVLAVLLPFTLFLFLSRLSVFILSSYRHSLCS
jgi:hypothetical protein